MTGEYIIPTGPRWTRQRSHKARYSYSEHVLSGAACRAANTKSGYPGLLGYSGSRQSTTPQYCDTVLDKREEQEILLSPDMIGRRTFPRTSPNLRIAVWW